MLQATVVSDVPEAHGELGWTEVPETPVRETYQVRLSEMHALKFRQHNTLAPPPEIFQCKPSAEEEEARQPLETFRTAVGEGVFGRDSFEVRTDFPTGEDRIDISAAPPLSLLDGKPPEDAIAPVEAPPFRSRRRSSVEGEGAPLRRLSLVESGTIAVEEAVKASRRMSNAFVVGAKALLQLGSSAKRLPLTPRTRQGRQAGRAVGNEVQALLMMVPGGSGDQITREQYRTLLDHELKRLKLQSVDNNTREHITRAVFREHHVLDLDSFDSLLHDIDLPVGALRGRRRSSERSLSPPSLTRGLSSTSSTFGATFGGTMAHIPVHTPGLRGALSRAREWVKRRTKAYWDDSGRQFSLTIYTLVNLVLVAFSISSRNGWLPGYEREVVGAHSGWWLHGARAFGLLCNFNCAFVVVPMLRMHLTYLQSTWLAEYIPFDQAYDFHQVVGLLAFLFGSIHGAFHVVNLLAWDGWSFDGHLWCGSRADGFLFCSAVSGLLVMAVFGVIVLFSLPRFRKTKHNVFWTTHHLVLLFYVILLLHGRVFWKWFLCPCALYLLDRIIRSRNASFVAEVVRTSHKHDGVLQIVFKKPWNLQYLPGQYVFLTAPVISKFEQHPFTLTSCPEDDNLECHIKSVGDWTEEMFHVYDPRDIQDGQPAYLHPSMSLRVAGPYGAPTQDWEKHETAVLICAGIGVTPFASVIKHIHLRTMQLKALRAAGLKVPQYLDLRLKKVYFYWICRSQESFRWFTDVIRAAQEDMGEALDVNVYLSSMAALGDVSAGMTHLGLHSYFHTYKRDALTQLRTLTHYHRPHWSAIFDKLADDHAGHKVGVFFCGPHSLGQTLSAQCNKSTASSSTTFAFSKENFG